jgi:tetratricopeptide (TPR) repeat protein
MPTLAVLNFENLSRDENLDFWRRGLPELLINGLYQSRFIKVLTREDSDAILKKLGLAEAKGYTSDDLARIGGEGQLTHIVTGSFLKAGDRIVVTLTLLDPRTRNVIQRRNVECQNQDEMFSKANDLTLQVKKDLNLSSEQLSADAEVYKKLEIATTSSAEAYKLFLEGRRLHGAMSYEESIAYMEKAVEIDPQFAMAYRSMASAYRNLGEAGKALKFGRKALELSGRLPELERMLIEAFYYQWAGDIRKAIEINEQVLKTYPENLMARGNLGGLTPDLDRSIALREFVFQRHKTGITIFNLADAYMEKGLYQKAEEVCRLYLRDIEDNSDIHWGLESAYLCRRQFDAAFAEAEKTALSVSNAAVFFKALMGDVLLYKDDFAGADKIYQQVFLMNPSSGRYQLISLDLSRGKFDEAIRRSRQVLTDARGGKEAPGAYWLLTAALEKRGRYDEASLVWVQYLQDSATLRKSELDAPRPYLPSEQLSDLFIRGRIQAEMKSFDEAQQTANELKSLGEKSVDPRDLRYYEYVQGLVELEKKNPRQAASLFARACQRLRFETILWEESRDHPLYFEGLARAYYESGELDKARLEFEKITLLTIARWSHGDIYAKTFYMLGKIAEQQGDKALAREKYQKFLDLWKDADPGLPEVADAKKRLAAL